MKWRGSDPPYVIKSRGFNASWIKISCVYTAILKHKHVYDCQKVLIGKFVIVMSAPLISFSLIIGAVTHNTFPYYKKEGRSVTPSALLV